MKNFSLTSVLFLGLSLLYGNSDVNLTFTFNWSDEATSIQWEANTLDKWTYEGASFGEDNPGIPYTIESFPVNGPGVLSVEIISITTEAFPKTTQLFEEAVGENLVFDAAVVKTLRGYRGRLAFTPIIKKFGQYERVTNLMLKISHSPSVNISKRGPDNTEQSILADGNIFKMEVSQTGIHKLTYNFLKDDLKIDIDNVDPRNIQLLGNGGGILPVEVNTSRIDDLAENPILIVGEEDGTFNPNDYILFYAEGANVWKFNEEDAIFNREQNIYSDKNYYFIRVGTQNGRRISDQPSLPNTDYTTTSFDDFDRFEEDRVNLMHEWVRAQGSGVNWYGDHFKNVREYTYNNLFSFPDLELGAPVKLLARCALRSDQRTAFQLDLNGRTFTHGNVDRVIPLSGDRDAEVSYAHHGVIEVETNLTENNFDFILRYPFPIGPGDGSEGWVDFIQVNVRRQLRMNGTAMDFRDIRSLDFGSTNFQLENVDANTLIWDITTPTQVKNQLFDLNGNVLSFGTNTSTLKSFIAFQSNADYPSPAAIGPIDNQNIHSITETDMVIIYHPEFVDQASRLAEFRRSHSQLNVTLVNIEHIYNEFSSGRQDPTALRDFAKMIYDRTPNFRFLLLFGDGSFDFKDIYGFGGNFIPVFQTDSFNPIFAYPTDDYYTIFQPETRRNSVDQLSADMNLAIGRLPVQNIQQATVLVDKIIDYESNPSSLQDWRNRIVMVGDDEDGGSHTNQAEEIADKINRIYPSFNINKIYLDAFPQESTPGGTRYPEVTQAINQSVFKGALSITYLGHGGSQGWAQERILNISDILSWDNDTQLPLFITATCSFAGYDDPAFTTAGEELVLNPRGGAAALFTTVRAVFSNENKALTDKVMEVVFDRPNGDIITLGEAMTETKNSFSGTFFTRNSRKFTLLGDPAMKLALPNYQITTETINNQTINETTVDTLGALQEVTVTGSVRDNNNAVFENFNGIIYPTIYDKPADLKTLGQDSRSPIIDFDLQRNILFKGRASIKNGKFSFTFVVPRDINYQLGIGKISYYAADLNQRIDAGGFSNNIAIGGTAENALVDNQGPSVEVFMNTEDFVFGGITDESPTLLVKLADDNGINVVGNSIGHDLEGTLDDNTQNVILLNDFYQAELDDYTKGVVQYPLTDLAEGRHTIKVKAWDVANNSAEGYTEFVVASSEGLALKHVLNYPNPFTDRTCFQFDHNIENIELDVQINIYTVSGRLVKQLQANIFSDGALRLDDCIEWDGRDDYGDRLARGVYLYKVKVRAQNTGEVSLESESEFEKLVLLK